MVKSVERAVLLNCIEVIKYCKSVGLDLNKLKSCRVEKMFDEYVFGLLKKGYDDDDSDWYLHEDLSTQPDIVLIVSCRDDEIIIKDTDKTYLLR